MIFMNAEDNIEFAALGIGFNYNYEFIYLHTHDYWEFVYFEKEVLHLHNKKKYLIPAHSVLIIKPSDHHAIIGTSKNNDFSPTHLNLKITTSRLQELLAPLDENLYNLLLSSPSFRPITLIHFKKMNNGIYSLLTQSPIPKATIIKKLILSIIESYEGLLYKNNELSHLPDYIQQLTLDLSTPENFTSTLQDILKKYPYSYMQLSRIFNKHHKQTLGNYFVEQKMSYAKNLLISTDSSILDIAISIGFSLSHFDHVFKNIYHVTPSEFREKRNLLSKMKL